jgi:hypothetical protein
MTRSLGKPAPLPYVDEPDLLLLAADLGHGVFPAGDLYDWHVSAVRQAGREPVTKKRFGMALKEAGWYSSTRYQEGRMTRCWMINKPWARRGQEYVANPAES